MPIFLRALSVANAVREWFTFTNEAVSWLGATKRVAAAGVIAAAVAAPVVVARPAATAQQLKDAHQVVQPARGVSVQRIIDECRDEQCNAYSTLYLMQPGRRPLAEQIVAECKESLELSSEQCNAAEIAISRLDARERKEKMIAARRKAEVEAPPVGRLTMPWEH